MGKFAKTIDKLMRTWLVILGLSAFPFCAFAQSSSIDHCKALARLLSEIDYALKQDDFADNVDYIFRKLRSAQVKAEDCDPRREVEVEERYERLFDQVKAQNDRAQEARAKALQEEKIAERESQRAQRSLLDLQKKQTESQQLLNIANTERDHMEATLSAIDFYDDKFGLAFDESTFKYGFIDRNLNEKIPFEYQEALPFKYRGFAKVKFQNEYYLIDTFNNRYRLATHLNELTPEVEALDLSYSPGAYLPDSLADYTNLKILFLGPSAIYDIRNIENLDKIFLLDLTSTEVSDLQPLQNLKQLQALYLYNTPVRDLSPLQNLTKIQLLVLSNTKVTNLAPLVNLTKITSLNLSNIQISDISPLQYMTQLQSLYLGSTYTQDLTPLQNLKQLELLFLYNTLVKDISPLKNLTKIQELDLDGTQISDLTPLQDLRLLKILSISNTLSSDLLPLQNLKMLEFLYLFDTQINTQQINQMKIILPSCSFVY